MDSRFRRQLQPVTAHLIQQAYTQIVQAHYSEFCELAGAHFQVAEAELSYSLPRFDNLFRFLEAFNGFYDHVGTTRNMAYRIWDQFRTIERIIRPASAIANSSDGIREPIESELLANSKQSVVDDLRIVETEAITMRDHHIHDYGAYFIPVEGKLRYILPQDEVLDYKTRKGCDVTDEDAVLRMKRHLGAIERFLDGSEAVLAQELSTALASVGISVDY